MEKVVDSRMKGKVRHQQAEILTYLVAAMIAGKLSIRRCLVWARAKESWLRRQKGMKLANGIASVSTVSRVLSHIDEEQFLFQFAEWAYEMNQLFLAGMGKEKKTGLHIAIDGKALNGSGSNVVPGSRPPMVLNAFCVTTGLVLAQYPIKDKSCELNEIPNLLGILELENAMVTIDAIGTHQNIMDQILEMGGHFLVQIKNNQPNALKDIKRIFKKFEKNHITYDSYAPGPEKNHDRIEYRSCRSSSKLGELESMEGWPIGSFSLLTQLRILMVRDEKGKDITPSRKEFLEKGSARQPAPCCGTEKENDYQEIGLASDEELSAKEYMEIRRKHWNIENSLHNVLDRAFREDKSLAAKSKNNLALLRKFSFNLLRLIERDVPENFRSMGEVMDYTGACEDVISKYIFHPLSSGEQPGK